MTNDEVTWIPGVACLIGLLFPMANARAAEKVTYETDVRPILREHCFACHNQDDATADLTLDSFEGVTAGGAGGEIVAAGNPDSSRLWKLVTHQESPPMPPGEKLPQPQLEVLRRWIAGGLLKDSGSKPLESKQPTLAKIDPSQLGKPAGEPSLPEQLFHEPVLWRATVGPVDALATSPWAPLVAIAWQRQVAFYHTDTLELLGILPYLDGTPQIVRFSRDGSLLLVAGGRHAATGSVSLFNVKTGARLAKLGDELDIVLAADISPDLSLVALGGPKKKVRVYRIADGSLAYQIDKHTDWITALGFSPDGRLLASTDRSGGAMLWQAAAGHERADLRGHQRAITALDWRADSTLLATASEAGNVRLWNSAGKPIKTVKAHPRGVLSVRFGKSGHWVSAGRDRRVKTWKSGGQAIADFGPLKGLALAAAFTHDDARVLASDYAGKIHVFHTSNKKPIGQLAANPLPLAKRKAVAEKKWKQIQRKVQASEKQLQADTLALEQGKATQAAHQNKLLAAEKTLEAKKKNYEQIFQLLSVQQKKTTSFQSLVQETANQVAEAEKSLQQAQAQAKAPAATEETQETETDRVAKQKQQLGAAQTAQQQAQQQLQQAQQSLADFQKKQQLSETEVENAESKLTRVTNETAGLPDVEKLTEQHNQATASVAATKQQVELAKQAHEFVAAQQKRLAQATQHWLANAKTQQTLRAELAKQTAKLTTQHKQAAAQLSSHDAQVVEVTHQLQDLQTQLEGLQKLQTELQSTESKLAAELRKLQQSLNKAEQETEQLETKQREFAAAQALRKKYLPHQKTAAQKE